MATSRKKTKAAQVAAEVDRLTAMFSTLPQKKREFAQKPIQQLAWLNVTIQELHLAIDKDGTISEYVHGANQSGTHQNPDVATLIKLQQQATSLFDKLTKLLDELPQEIGSKLSEFV